LSTLKSFKKADQEDLELVIYLLEQVCPLSAALKKEIYANMVTFSYLKDEILVDEGGVCQYMYFIKKGALMGCTTYKSKKIVTYITVENEFVSSISGLHGKHVSKEEISAVEDSELLAIRSDTLQDLFKVHFDLNFLFRIMVEQYYMDAQERTHIVRVGSAKERYLYFIQTRQHFMERLPYEYVASLLDMKPLTLLKIKKQHELSLKKDKQTEELCKCIEKYMVEEKIFKVKDLSLNSLSKVLNLSTHQLSSLLNNHFQQKFMDFVNTYRIKHIKEQIAIPSVLHNYTIETVANNAGFSSRSAFYNAFKKIVGMSPVEYSKSLVQ
jgi:AraC-like DNA-binding protein